MTRMGKIQGFVLRARRERRTEVGKWFSNQTVNLY